MNVNGQFYTFGNGDFIACLQEPQTSFSEELKKVTQYIASINIDYFTPQDLQSKLKHYEEMVLNHQKTYPSIGSYLFSNIWRNGSNSGNDEFLYKQFREAVKNVRINLAQARNAQKIGQVQTLSGRLALLGLSEMPESEASLARVFREKSAPLHPDRNRDASSSDLFANEEAFKELSEAKDFIKKILISNQ
ncbi:MAG: hypothetical protein S4CHLAM123_09990 [Chlamydiales bacterium]|nr:hypothetical protein [Chlamydiales bacterium]